MSSRVRTFAPFALLGILLLVAGCGAAAPSGALKARGPGASAAACADPGPGEARCH